MKIANNISYYLNLPINIVVFVLCIFAIIFILILFTIIIRSFRKFISVNRTGNEQLGDLLLNSGMKYKNDIEVLIKEVSSLKNNIENVNKVIINKDKKITELVKK